MHGISEQKWIDYFDGLLIGTDLETIEKHLVDCRECQYFRRRMERAEKSLLEAGAEIKHAFPIAEEQVNVGLAKVLARILDSEAKQQNLGQDAIQERLEQLEDILAAMCGSWTAVNALRVAAEGTMAQTPPNLTTETWAPFLKRLKGIASVFCGDTGAKLVWEYGQL